MFYWLERAVAIIFLKLFTRCEVAGRENLPSKGPLLVVFNHLGHMDPVLLVSTFPWRMHGLAVAGLREVPVTGCLLSLGGVIWLRRGEYDREALRRGLAVLRRGEVLAIAPEGRVSLTGALERAKTGPAFLARWAKVPLLPIGITGTEDAIPKLLHFQRPHLRMVIGKPFDLPRDLPKGSRKEELRWLADFIIGHIAELLPSKYRGVYGGDGARE
jgi:1-acyl-sn-glycerol-3-phosphate acyltransferase